MVAKANLFKQSHGAIGCSPSRSGYQINVLPHRPPFEKPRLLEYHADSGLQPRRFRDEPAMVRPI